MERSNPKYSCPRHISHLGLHLVGFDMFAPPLEVYQNLDNVMQSCGLLTGVLAQPELVLGIMMLA